MTLPRSGDILRVTQAASVQFKDPMLFRVIRVHDWPTYDGWTWLDGYQLDSSGDAVERRSIFVLIGGIQQVPALPQRRLPSRTATRRRTAPPLMLVSLACRG
jgi:hypothetical protein